MSKDENLHMIFYRNIVSAALDIAPDATMQAITKEVIGFEMPGATMAGFRRSSMMIAKAGIYDQRLHYDGVIMPVLRHWRVLDRTDFGPEGEQAREQLAQRRRHEVDPEPGLPSHRRIRASEVDRLLLAQPGPP
ncbi:acyl-ACP desaturase [Microbacterium sp. B2969]|uniref:Acyl-ACP desaturase n=1 Tax=Microbacterium alkaliflavum TaxID=3248839 RepID=A0ABW7Q6G6_9MICO